MPSKVCAEHSAVEETPSASWWHRCTPTALTICVGLGLTLGLFSLIRHWEHRENQTGFDFASKHLVEAIRRAAERIELTHEIVCQAYYGSSTVSRREFQLFSKPILGHVPSLKVLQWAPRVSNQQRSEFEQDARRSGLPQLRNFQICTAEPHNKLTPVRPRDEYFPIWYAETAHNFSPNFGWDFGSIPVLRAAMHRARDTNTFQVSPPITLDKLGREHPLVQTFLPVYRNLQDARTPKTRPAHLRGYLVGLCQVDDLVEQALEYASGPQGIDLAVIDRSLPAGQQLLHFHSSRTRSPAQHGEDAARQSLALEPAGLHYTASLKFGGREWSLLCTPAPVFFNLYGSWRSWTLLVLSLLMTYVAARYTWSATTRTERIERMVAERTHELRQKDEQLRQSQKLEAVGALAGGVAHEFNNLLQAISGYTRYAMEGIPPDQQPYQDLQGVLEAADRAASLTRQLLSFSRRQTVDRKHLDANEMVSDLTRMLRPLLGEHIKLRTHLGEQAGVIFADAGSFQQVFVNLCLNARDAMPSGGEIVVKTERLNVSPEFAEHYADLKPGPYVELSVADTGHGMTPEVREHIFEPFFTTKPVGQGTGLGLPTVYGIVQQHEGAIHVYSEPGHGSTFKIYLPAIASDADPAPQARPAASRGGAEVILVAEDDPLVQDISRRILEKGGYTVLTARDGEETLQVLRQRRDTIALVLLDAVMPKLSGREVYRRLHDEFPEIRVIFCSGYDPETSQSNFIAQEHLRLVEKPYNPAVLLQTVREELDAEEVCRAS